VCVDYTFTVGSRVTHLVRDKQQRAGQRLPKHRQHAPYNNRATTTVQQHKIIVSTMQQQHTINEANSARPRAAILFNIMIYM